MTAPGMEFFSMNNVNRLRILQEVIDRRLTSRTAVIRLEISDRYGRRLAIVNMGRYHLLNVVVASRATGN